MVSGRLGTQAGSDHGMNFMSVEVDLGLIGSMGRFRASLRSRRRLLSYSAFLFCGRCYIHGGRTIKAVSVTGPGKCSVNERVEFAPDVSFNLM